MAFEDHWGKKMVEGRGKVAERIQVHLRSGGTEPCTFYEEHEEWTGRRNLLERTGRVRLLQN